MPLKVPDLSVGISWCHWNSLMHAVRITYTQNISVFFQYRFILWFFSQMSPNTSECHENKNWQDRMDWCQWCAYFQQNSVMPLECPDDSEVPWCHLNHTMPMECSNNATNFHNAIRLAYVWYQMYADWQWFKAPMYGMACAWLSSGYLWYVRDFNALLGK